MGEVRSTEQEAPIIARYKLLWENPTGYTLEYKKAILRALTFDFIAYCKIHTIKPLKKYITDVPVKRGTPGVWVNASIFDRLPDVFKDRWLILKESNPEIIPVIFYVSEIPFLCSVPRNFINLTKSI